MARIANLFEDAQAAYVSWWITPSARVGLNRQSSVDSIPIRAFDLGVTEANSEVSYEPRPSSVLEGGLEEQLEGLFFQFQLPEGSTTLGACTFVAGTVPSSAAVTPTTGRVERYWSSSANPQVQGDWTLIGTANIDKIAAAFSLSDPSVTTAKWIGFRIQVDKDFNLKYFIRNVRQMVVYPRQPIEIENADQSQINDTFSFATLFKGSLPADGLTHALRVRNTTGATKVVNIRRIAHHEIEQSGTDIFQILSRLKLSTTSATEGFTAADSLSFSVPNGGADFWLRYQPVASDESVQRNIGLCGLYLEVVG